MSEITPVEITQLVARLGTEPGATALVAQIKRQFTPEQLAARASERLRQDNPRPRQPKPRKPKQPSLAARLRTVIRVAKAAGINVQRVEVDGVLVSAGKPNDNGEPNEWDVVIK